MRPPPSGEAEALKPSTNKKRKSRAVVARPDGTAALTSRSNPNIEGEDDDGSPLRRRTRVDLDISGIVKATEKSIQQEMYDHAILRLYEELFFHEKERKNIALKLQDSEARCAQGDKELGELRAALEAALREKAALAAQVEQSDSWISQLKTEISELKERNEIVARELVTSRDLLTDTRREIVTLAAAKSEVKRDAATYKKDVTTTHTMVRDMSMAAEQRLIRAVEHAKVEAKRETLEELEARGFELSTDLEKARASEGRLALLIVPDKGEDDSG
ncbi:COP1-interactive protein 1-like [Nicotiana sylvestris]|uniref:COP1-interactive protein 1-like n=1 Tax=Nicotiana sylvestris TaxID=4096 RepID=UPI00388CC21F